MRCRFGFQHERNIQGRNWCSILRQQIPVLIWTSFSLLHCSPCNQISLFPLRIFHHSRYKGRVLLCLRAQKAHVSSNPNHRVCNIEELCSASSALCSGSSTWPESCSQVIKSKRQQELMILRQLEGWEGRSNVKEEIVTRLEIQENRMFHTEANHLPHSRTRCNF